MEKQKSTCAVCGRKTDVDKLRPVILGGIRYIWFCEKCYNGESEESEELSRFKLMDLD